MFPGVPYIEYRTGDSSQSSATYIWYDGASNGDIVPGDEGLVTRSSVSPYSHFYVDSLPSPQYYSVLDFTLPDKWSLGGNYVYEPTKHNVYVFLARQLRSAEDPSFFVRSSDSVNFGSQLSGSNSVVHAQLLKPSPRTTLAPVASSTDVDERMSLLMIQLRIFHVQPLIRQVQLLYHLYHQKIQNQLSVD